MRSFRFLLVLLITSVLWTLPLSAAGRVSILCYHAFLDSSNPYCFSINELRGHLETLKKQGVNFVTFDDVVSGRIGKGKNVLVTVDDGNHTMYRAWKEVFRPMGIRPVIGIYPAIIGRKEYAMTWSQVRELADEGCTIAAHGWFHLFVNKKPETEEDEKYYKREISRSRKVLQEKLGRQVDLFVYPFGGVNDYAIGRLRQEGYRWALSLGNRECDMPLSGDGLYRIPRYLMTRRDGNGLIARIGGAAPPALAIHHSVKSSGTAAVTPVANKAGANTGAVPAADGTKTRKPRAVLQAADTGTAVRPAHRRHDAPVLREGAGLSYGMSPAAFADRKGKEPAAARKSNGKTLHGEAPAVSSRSREKKKERPIRGGETPAPADNNLERRDAPVPGKVTGSAGESTPPATAAMVPAIPLKQPGFGIFCRNVFRQADMMCGAWILYIRHRLPAPQDPEGKKKDAKSRTR